MNGLIFGYVDVIWGQVVRVVDGDTFYLRVTKEGILNRFHYYGLEKVRLKDINAPEYDTPEGLSSTIILKRLLEGKLVKCRVYARDTFGRVIADVIVLS